MLHRIGEMFMDKPCGRIKGQVWDMEKEPQEEIPEVTLLILGINTSKVISNPQRLLKKHWDIQ